MNVFTWSGTSVHLSVVIVTDTISKCLSLDRSDKHDNDKIVDRPYGTIFYEG